jgi:short-subunit dehydrogenase
MPLPLRILILGATSEIARAVARLYAADGARLLLVGRDPVRLDAMARNLEADGAAGVETAVLDLTTDTAPDHLPDLAARLGGIDHVLMAWGRSVLPAESPPGPALAAQLVETNYASVLRWALPVADLLEAQGHGTLVVLGSVSGDRGRRKNFVYGSTKAGVAVLIEGIAHRLACSGARAVLVKAGPTATATAGDDGRGRTPVEAVARAVRRAADGGGAVQYVPARWRLIMRLVREMPWWLFRRTDF